MISEKLSANRPRLSGANSDGAPEDDLLMDEHGMFY